MCLYINKCNIKSIYTINVFETCCNFYVIDTLYYNFMNRFKPIILAICNLYTYIVTYDNIYRVRRLLQIITNLHVDVRNQMFLKYNFVNFSD